MAVSLDIPSIGLFGEAGTFPDLVHCEQYSARAPYHDWYIPAHRHANMVQLHMIYQGGMKARLDSDEHRLDDMEFAYIPAHCVHEFHFDPDTEGDVLSLPLPVVQSVGPAPEEVTSALSGPFTGPIDGRLAALVTLLREGLRTAEPFRAQQVVGLAHSVLAHLARIALASRRPDSLPRRLDDLDALIAAHMAEGWSASDYARALSMTTGHLSRLCRDATGMGTAAYVERAVMTEACRLLAFTGLPVSEVGYRLGYADPSHFSKRFRAARGDTPTRYRARVGA